MEKELRLHCGYAGVPTPTVQWFHNNSLLTSGSGGVIITDGVVGDSNNYFTSVEIKLVNCANIGNYTCWANNSLGSDEANYTVQILGRSTITLTALCIATIYSMHTTEYSLLSFISGGRGEGDGPGISHHQSKPPSPPSTMVTIPYVHLINVIAADIRLLINRKVI